MQTNIRCNNPGGPTQSKPPNFASTPKHYSWFLKDQLVPSPVGIRIPISKAVTEQPVNQNLRPPCYPGDQQVERRIMGERAKGSSAYPPQTVPAESISHRFITPTQQYHPL